LGSTTLRRGRAVTRVDVAEAGLLSRQRRIADGLGYSIGNRDGCVRPRQRHPRDHPRQRETAGQEACLLRVLLRRLPHLIRPAEHQVGSLLLTRQRRVEVLLRHLAVVAAGHRRSPTRTVGQHVAETGSQRLLRLRSTASHEGVVAAHGHHVRAVLHVGGDVRSGQADGIAELVVNPRVSEVGRGATGRVELAGVADRIPLGLHTLCPASSPAATPTLAVANA
jgi:hypothetical protein